MRWRNTETPTFAGSAGSNGKPAIVEIHELVDRDNSVVASFTKAVDGSITLSVDGAAAGGLSAPETPTGLVNGSNDAFEFSAPPKMVFRNGVMEFRLGTVSVNTFTFDTPPETGDDIEGYV